MNRKPIPCPESGETCTRPDCSATRCVDQGRIEPLRDQVRRAHRLKVREGMDLSDMTLGDLDALPDLDA
jgi:hypothetical protein